MAPKYLHQTNIKFNDYIETPTQNTWVARGKELVEEIHKNHSPIQRAQYSVFAWE